MAPAFQDCPWSVAHAADVECSNAIVHVVTYAIPIVVSVARPSAHAEGVKLVSIAIAMARRDVFTPAFVDLSSSVANAASVKRADAAVHIVAHPVAVHIGVARASANAQRIHLVSAAIAVPFRQVVAPAFVHDARTVAHPTGIQSAHATVDVIADAIVVEVLGTRPTTLPDGVQLVPLAVAIARRKEVASARVNGTWAVANAASIQGANASIFIVADAVKVHVEVAPASAHPDGVLFASEAIAFPFLDVVATALVNRAGSVAHPARVEGPNAFVVHVANAVVVHIGGAISAAFAKDVLDVALAVAFTVWNFVASAIEDGAGAVAFAAFVKLAHTVIHVVADAIAIQIFGTIASTHAQGVFDIAVAIAFAVVDFVTAAFENSARAVAFPAFVQFTDALVLVVADAVVVCIGRATPAAHLQGVFDIACTIACALGEGTASTLVHSARSVADATSVVGSDAVVHIVAHPVFVLVQRAGSTAFADHVRCDARTPALVDGPGAVADTADVKRPDAIVAVVADAVLIGIRLAIAPAHSSGIWKVAFAPADKQVKVWRDATAVVFRGGLIKIASVGICAPSEHATSVVGVGVGVEVRSVFVEASANHVGVERHVKTQVVFVVSLREDLDAHGTAEVAVCGELGEQHALSEARDGVGGGPRNHGPARSAFTFFHKPLSRTKQTFPSRCEKHGHALFPGRRR